ncbi:hypothetical protein O6H91_19G003000 [Diphasiastrum complanatum]|uniref:Uncharacterized protein n=4 Tax=Diphasiastrum complanatum TaxID=34168 RepID=A0ACC2AS83_DIPCM|nr:hypothetical protein O6H91_19G003000 [Diphasiastrum complanatum]KAJ7520376.1 hypothetical protein O6H91_19G003000 [Diphasiastrum complanatum]KAJ7520377.1 hypothetical protein O6H91_19G003000 [Diphasiastrum complanatum]KAJ7520378.1 hypothetical protein O6H91_19G003000 [Diphasiastrum complanatum]
MLKSFGSTPWGLELGGSFPRGSQDVASGLSTTRAFRFSRKLFVGACTKHQGIEQLLGLSCRGLLKCRGMRQLLMSRGMRCFVRDDLFLCQSYRHGGRASSLRKKRMHPGAYEVIDEETGEKVIVWGVEGEERPVLTPSDLKWKPAEVVLPGEISEEAWHRIMETSTTNQSRHSQEQSSEEDGEIMDEGCYSASPEPKHELVLNSHKGRAINSNSILEELRQKKSEINRRKEDESFKSRASNLVGNKKSEASRRKEDESFKLKASNLEENAYNISKATPSGIKKLQRVHEREESTTFSPRLVDGYFSIQSFKNLGANAGVIQALLSMQIKRPSEIQAIAFKSVLEGRSCIVADQTGSGKTLAYLTPLIQRLKEDEHKGICLSAAKSPCILILAPTSELAVQIFNVCRSFSKGGCPIKSMVATGGFKWKTQVESLDSGPNIVVATPGRFLHHLEAGNLLLDNLKSVVLDEVDILFEEEDFSKAMHKIGERAPLGVQYVHVTATLPVDIYKNLLKKYPGSIPLLGPTLHRTVAGLQEILVDCSGDSDAKSPEMAFLNKKGALLQLVEQTPAAKTIVFCNKIETCRKVENLLRRFDRPGKKICVLPYHAALTQEARLQNIQQFLHSEPDKSFFLVCTDRASRGLDSVNVEHIILFDFPRDPSEYVRRVGRTARGAGGTGKVFVFVVGKQVSLARRIMVKNEKGHPIHSVPGET